MSKTLKAQPLEHYITRLAAPRPLRPGDRPGEPRGVQGELYIIMTCVVSAPYALDLVEQLALALARLEVLVAGDSVLEVERLVDPNLEVARCDPAEDLVGAHHELLARRHVVEHLRPRHEERLFDEPDRREGGHRARRVAEGDKDAAPRERVERDVHRRGADAVDDRLDALAVGHLHHLADDVDRGVVLVRRASDCVGDDELVAGSGAVDALLALGAGADHLVPLELRHLRRPLAGASAHAVDEHPLAWLDQARVRVVGQVVRREALRHARDRLLESDSVRHLHNLGCRHGRVLAVRAEHGVGDSLAGGEPGRRRLWRHVDDSAAALLARDKGQLLRVRGAALAEVRVDEVDAGVLVLD
mmetsp:Transcript_15049/g.44646  ORF Transcript_15049/g.44646 Transcript_15049/m.44646 type:complete len:359 (+) Transcript_15049:41-1117(+)